MIDEKNKLINDFQQVVIYREYAILDKYISKQNKK